MTDLYNSVTVETFRFNSCQINLAAGGVWDIALGQRVWGPRQLLVATAYASGDVIGLAHCDQTNPPEMALHLCLAALEEDVPWGPAAVVAFSDEMISPDCEPDYDDLAARFTNAQETASEFGLVLVDWIICDDLYVMSLSLSLDESDLE